MLIDTHSHLYSDDYSDDREAVIARALSSDVGKIILPNIDSCIDICSYLASLM